MIELAVEPLDEFCRCGCGERCGRIEPVDLELDAHMSGGLHLQIATALILIELASQSAFDIAGSRIIPFDQVAILGVHDAD